LLGTIPVRSVIVTTVITSVAELELTKSLVTMGYRRMDATTWGKPLGAQLLLFKDKKLSLYFRSHSDSKPLLWDSKTLEGSTVEDIIDLECDITSGYSAFRGDYRKGFGFISQEEQVNIFLNLV